MFSRCNVSMDGAESVLKDVGLILNTVSEYFQSEMLEVAQLLSKDEKEILRVRVSYVAEKVKSSLNSFNTEQRMTTILERKHVLELPQRKVYNEKVVQIDDSLKTIKSEAILLPIEHQIRSLLEKPQVLDSMLDYQSKIDSSTESNFSSYLNSTHWKEAKEKFPGKHVLPIFLYNDDFGPDDGLSPHGGSNKVSAYYCSFPSLPPQYRSLIQNIHVLMLAKSEEIKEVGANKLLEILAKALIPFEKNGIDINGKTIHILPVLLMGDNMGLNLNLGYMGHAATFFCRFCFMMKNETQTCCKENERYLRTQTHYSNCLENIGRGGKNFGVISKCDLELLASFRVSKNYVVDIMHDLLSGVFLYDIKELIKKGIDDKLFTLEDFNQAKNSFDYGVKENEYRMEDVKSSTNVKSSSGQSYACHCHAREMLCLVKFLPFIFKKILPTDNSLYKFSLLMVDLQDMTLKTSFSTSDLQTLESVIHKHNREFLRLFSRNLTPKFHNLLHYVRVIKACGPLKDLWSMRFESKHQELKTQARVMHSRRHICLSFAKKICFQNAYNALENENFMKHIKSYSKSHILFLEAFRNELTFYENCTKVNYCGSIYSIDNFFISNCGKFAFKIKQLGLRSNTDELKVITEKFSLKYTNSLRSFQILESLNLYECFDVTNFKTPCINKHLFEGLNYLRKEDF